MVLNKFRTNTLNFEALAQYIICCDWPFILKPLYVITYAIARLELHRNRRTKVQITFLSTYCLQALFLLVEDLQLLPLHE